MAVAVDGGELEGLWYTAEGRYVARELAWLGICERVLELAEDATLSLMERVKFLAMLNRDLDEFFQTRVAGHKQEAGLGGPVSISVGMAHRRRLDAIGDRVRTLTARRDRTFSHDIRPSLAAAGVRLEDVPSLDECDRARLQETFERQLFPLLTPLAVDPAHPFPHISNLSLSLAVVVRDPATGVSGFANVKVPPGVPRFLSLEDNAGFLPLEQLIAAHVQMLFPGMEIASVHPFRVTRDIVGPLRGGSHQAVRLEVDDSIQPRVRAFLLAKLGLAPSDVYMTDAMLRLDDLWQLAKIDQPGVTAERWPKIRHGRPAAGARGRVPTGAGREPRWPHPVPTTTRSTSSGPDRTRAR